MCGAGHPLQKLRRESLEVRGGEAESRQAGRREGDVDAAVRHGRIELGVADVERCQPRLRAHRFGDPQQQIRRTAQSAVAEEHDSLDLF